MVASVLELDPQLAIVAANSRMITVSRNGRMVATQAVIHSACNRSEMEAVMARSKGRAGRPYCRLRDQIRAISRVCWICGHAIDLTLSPRHPLSWTLDHLMPLSKGGARSTPPTPAPRTTAATADAVTRSAPKPTTSRRW